MSQSEKNTFCTYCLYSCDSISWSDCSLIEGHVVGRVLDGAVDGSDEHPLGRLGDLHVTGVTTNLPLLHNRKVYTLNFKSV